MVNAANITSASIAGLIKRDCSQYLIAMQKAKQLIVRGMQWDECRELDMFKGKSRAKRNPLDSDPQTQKLFDNCLVKLGFKALRSNSTFCTSNIEAASGYGLTYILFPFNSSPFTWSTRMNDLVLNNKDLYDVYTFVTPPKVVKGLSALEPHLKQLLKWPGDIDPDQKKSHALMVKHILSMLADIKKQKSPMDLYKSVKMFFDMSHLWYQLRYGDGKPLACNSSQIAVTGPPSSGQNPLCELIAANRIQNGW